MSASLPPMAGHSSAQLVRHKGPQPGLMHTAANDVHDFCAAKERSSGGQASPLGVVEAERIRASRTRSVDLSRDQRDEIPELRIEVARLGATLAELREQRAKGTFRFARERDEEASELPNPLSPRRVARTGVTVGKCWLMSALPPKADLPRILLDFAFVPKPAVSRCSN
jgi:hypothetical protein